MDTLLKPMMKLLPKRKTAGGSKGAKGGEEAKEPPPNLHHLLYAMKNLNPKFIAVATEVSIVPWSIGAKERPEIDAFLTVMRDAELERKHTKTKKHKKKGGVSDDDDEFESDEGEAHPHGAERSKSKSSADGTHHGAAAATDAAATKAKDDDEKNKKKKKKSLPSYGCCLTDKGTLTFISPDGLAMLEASINRRNMRLIEVKKARHCVDAEVDGVKVTIVWSFIDNSAQTGDKAKSKFKEVASEVLPDVEYLEIFSSDDDDDDDDESDKRSVDPQSDKGGDSMVHDPTDGAPAHAVDDGKRRSTRPLPETPHYEPISDDDIPSPPPEYEQLQGEPDEAPFDLTPAVRRLERARLATMQLTARKKAAQKWLAAYEAQQQEELLKQSTAANNNSLTSADDATLEVDAVHVSDRETVLRLALLIAVICDKQRTLTSALTVKLAPPPTPSSMGHF